MGKRSLRLYKYMALAALVSLVCGVVQAHNPKSQTSQKQSAPAGCQGQKEDDPVGCEGGGYAKGSSESHQTT